MRLLEQANLTKGGHDVAQGGGTQALAIGKEARKRLRGDRLAGSDVQVDDCGKHQPFTWAEAHIGHLPCSPKCRRFRRQGWCAMDSGVGVE